MIKRFCDFCDKEIHHAADRWSVDIVPKGVNTSEELLVHSKWEASAVAAADVCRRCITDVLHHVYPYQQACTSQPPDTK